MQSSRSVLVLTLILSSPIPTAYAGVVDHWGDPDAIPLVVQYEGTIFEADMAPPGYAVGDRLSGRLLVDTRLPYFESSFVHVASYTSHISGFVSGFWPEHGHGPGDAVTLAWQNTDLGPRPIDLFGIVDEHFDNDTDDVRFGGRTFSLSARLHGMLSDVSLNQNFEVTQADVDEPDESEVHHRSSNGEAGTLHGPLRRLAPTPSADWLASSIVSPDLERLAHSTIGGPNAMNLSNWPNGRSDMKRLRGASNLKPRPSKWRIATALTVGT
jgi:hypothetical protein